MTACSFAVSAHVFWNWAVRAARTAIPLFILDRTLSALGLEALERFVHKEPLRRVHECVFGVLALESEPVDPRL
jgi:hypothetical protein